MDILNDSEDFQFTIYPYTIYLNYILFLNLFYFVFELKLYAKRYYSKSIRVLFKMCVHSLTCMFFRMIPIYFVMTNHFFNDAQKNKKIKKSGYH